jgi:hypothetical protein
MQRDVQAEVILCPNCNEDVPKTLYCLNCGYPLYKVEKEQDELEEAELVEIEAAPEVNELTPLPEADVEASFSIDIPVPVESMSLDEGVEELQLTSAVEVVEMELTEAEEAQGEMEVELEEQIQETVEENTGILESPEVIEEVEAEVLEVVEEPMTIEMVEEKSSEEILDILVDFQPDPQTRTVMENLVKNISVKVKLINLLREGNVKEVTFTRLFESYESQGDRWKNRRIEELERSRYNLDTMEKTLADTKMKLEELEIRKAIGDASDKEYQAKSPAFKWEIDELENELKQRKGEIAYLENLDRAIPVEDMEELRATVESRQAFLNNLIEEERISSETATKINASLERIVNYIDNPNNY